MPHLVTQQPRGVDETARAVQWRTRRWRRQELTRAASVRRSRRVVSESVSQRGRGWLRARAGHRADTGRCCCQQTPQHSRPARGVTAASSSSHFATSDRHSVSVPNTLLLSSVGGCALQTPGQHTESSCSLLYCHYLTDSQPGCRSQLLGSGSGTPCIRSDNEPWKIIHSSWS